MASIITDDQIGQRLYADAKAQALGMAKLAGHGPDQKQLTPDEENLLFMRVAPGWTLEQELALLADGKTPAQVGALKYPERQKMAQAGERFLDKYAQAQYLATIRKRLDPTWQPLPPPGPAPLPAEPVAPTEPPPSAGVSSFPLGG